MYSKHTRGPWRIEVIQIDDYCINIASKPTFKAVATATTLDPIDASEEEMANTRLIALSPELYGFLFDLFMQTT